MLEAGPAIATGNLPQSAERQRRREGPHDKIAAEPPRQFDRRLRERRDIRRNRPLHRFRCDRYAIELVVLAVMRDRLVAFPQPPHDAHTLFEDRLVILEADMERLVFAAVVTAARGKIDAPAREQV